MLVSVAYLPIGFLQVHSQVKPKLSYYDIPYILEIHKVFLKWTEKGISEVISTFSNDIFLNVAKDMW